MKKIKITIVGALSLLFITACAQTKQNSIEPVSFQTVCNPVNLSYMYQSDKPSYREGADPTVLMFRGDYYAFVSHSGGYFHSTDLIRWDLIVPNDIFPVKTFAPTTVIIDDAIYVIASGGREVVKTTDPQSGIWEMVNPDFKIRNGDPALFLDDDGRLYYFDGCSNVNPIKGYELDPKTFEPITEGVVVISSDRFLKGWEEKSDDNTPQNTTPWIEGAWLNKYKGKYYLQYASPGTELKSYNDAVYVADKPLGPYTIAEHNPISYKPEGYVCGAGHGSTFQDKYGNFWHIATASISIRHMFERRLSLFPLFFDNDDEMYAYTRFGDYPVIIPDTKVRLPEDLFPGWMLLSYKKPTEVSSTFSEYTGKNINDENIRTWWSAASGGSNEWFSLDLKELSDVYAIQINFADEGTQLAGRADNIYYRYTIEQSADGKKWELLIDQSQNTQDAPHDYIQLKQPVRTRYLRVKNVYVPSGHFAISDFRVFGKSNTKAPQAVSACTAVRDADRRTVKLSWKAVPGATGYNVRYGSRADKLYLNYMVYEASEITIHSLNAGQEYFFTVEAFNEGGIATGSQIIKE
jgi:hypothetical protein